MLDQIQQSITGYRRIERIGNAILLLGDCREILPSIEAVDHVITDTPYGEDDTHDKHMSSLNKGKALRDGYERQELGFEGISEQELIDYTKQWIQIARRWVVYTTEWKYMTALDRADLLIRFGIWRKTDGAPQFTGDRPGTGWEAVSICHRPGKKRWNGGGKHAVWTHPKGRDQSGHPTPKPVNLYKDFVNDFTDRGEIILDPMMGRGTTGVACVDLGRFFIGIEVKDEHFNAACVRLEQAQQQGRLFA